MGGQSFLSPQSPPYRIVHISVGHYAHKLSLSCSWPSLFFILGDKLILKKSVDGPFRFLLGRLRLCRYSYHIY